MEADLRPAVRVVEAQGVVRSYPWDMNEIMTLLRQHRSIRKYTDATIPAEDLRDAIACAQQAATSSNIQSYCLIRVTDPEKRRRLIDLTGGQEKVASCAAFFMVCGDQRRMRMACEIQGTQYTQRLEGFLLATIDATLFAQNLVVAFESMGYGTCYIGGLRNELPEVDAMMQLPSGVFPLYGLCVGRPDEDPGVKPRMPLDAIYFEDAYPSDAEMRASIDRYDDTMRQYYEERTGKTRTWSGLIARKFAEPLRENLAAYYTSKDADLS